MPASPAPTISTFLPWATNEPRRGRSISERASTRAPPSRISVKTRSSSERALRGRALACRPGAEAVGDRRLLDVRHAVRAPPACSLARRAAWPGRREAFGWMITPRGNLTIENADEQRDARDRERAREGVQVGEREVAPPLVVAAEAGQADDLDRDHDQDGLLPVRVPARVAVDLEADDVCRVPRHGHEDRVHGDLPEPVAVQQPHSVGVYDLMGERAATTSTTSRWAASPSVGNIGSARHSRAQRSVTGNEPSAWPRCAKTGCMCSGLA